MRFTEELGRRARLAVVAGAIVLTAAIGAASAPARPAKAAKDGRPNILVVMTDDMSAADLKLMPNVQRLLAAQGDDLRRRGRLVPALLPGARDLHHRPVRAQPWRQGQLRPVRLVRDEGPQEHPSGLARQDAGYRTALIGKWLNGYGALDAHGEVPKGFDIWRGLLDVSAYDYFNFVMNMDGKLRVLGRRRLRSQAGRVRADRGRRPARHASPRSSPGSRSSSARAPTATGAPTTTEDYSPDVTGKITEKPGQERAQVAASRSSSGGRPPRRTARTSRPR